MRRVSLIGIGAGDPEHLTIQAVRAMNEADVFFIPDKGREKADLKHQRTRILERFVENRAYRTVEVETPRRASTPDYQGDVAAWHARIAAAYAELLTHDLGEGECGAFLVWGDPTLYDSTLRILEALQADGLALSVEVIPGISSVQALAAAHKIPLNRIGKSVAIVPGRQIADRLPQSFDDVVVVLDGDRAFRRVVADDLDIFWGAYIGTADEVLIAGRLSEVADEIEALRDRKRREKGWIMDTYLLRRRGDGQRD